ncbi:hypothetical protein SSS_10183 [Sarcoptes scabiei]|nr:hypothetical protein SSS_10183 [Sarcoptes scabiei]
MFVSFQNSINHLHLHQQQHQFHRHINSLAFLDLIRFFSFLFLLEPHILHKYHCWYLLIEIRIRDRIFFSPLRHRELFQSEKQFLEKLSREEEKQQPTTKFIGLIKS